MFRASIAAEDVGAVDRFEHVADSADGKRVAWTKRDSNLLLPEVAVLTIRRIERTLKNKKVDPFLSFSRCQR
jgi:hypothetical protein